MRVDLDIGTDVTVGDPLNPPANPHVPVAVPEVSGRIDLAGLALEQGREHPLLLTARQRDQSRVWTSALFVIPG